jgi:putative sigma-54 modulation protein
MQLNISGHHIAVTPPLRQYVSQKLERLQRHCDSLVNADCILTVEKLQHKAEATLRMRGVQIYADAIEEDMYAAIDGLADKLDKQVRRRKGKQFDHHARDVDKAAYG